MYFILTRFILPDTGPSRRIVAGLGVLSATWGIVWGIVMAAARSITGRAKLLAINSFGLVPAFAGLTLIFWTVDSNRLFIAAGAVLLVTLAISLMAPLLEKGAR